MFSLEVHNLVKRFGGNVVLSDVSLGFEAGKITGIIGPNGSGKSTLMNLVTGMLPIDDGAVIVGDRSFVGMKVASVRDFGITRTFQEVRLFEQMSVMDNLLVVLAHRSPVRSVFQRFTRAQKHTISEALARVHLSEKKSVPAEKLSYGQRKLLEITRAVLTGSSIFLFDEPFAGLSPVMVETVSGVLHDLRKQGKTVILIEHNMELIRRLCDVVYVLDGGKVLAHGEPTRVLAQRDVVEAYLGE